MKQLNYTLKVRHIDEPDSIGWDEPMQYNVGDNVTAEEHGQSIIDAFNRSLRDGECARVMISAISDNESDIQTHNWEKYNAVTQSGGYDTYKCSKCGVTGKRYGLNGSIKLDYRYRKYQNKCKSI
jgi:hypothetical protein